MTTEGQWTIDFQFHSGQKLYHVVPMQDTQAHTVSETCPCCPVQDNETPTLWVHNSFDGREQYEEGWRKPN